MGKTILISSHILLELADLCNKVGIIEQGQLRFVGTIDEMIERAKTGAILHVDVAERRAEAANMLSMLPGVSEAALHNEHIRVEINPDLCAAPVIAQKLVEGGFAMTRLEEEKVNLETAFMRLTKGLVQ